MKVILFKALCNACVISDSSAFNVMYAITGHLAFVYLKGIHAICSGMSILHYGTNKVFVSSSGDA